MPHQSKPLTIEDCTPRAHLFWPKVLIGAADDCWPWRAYKDRDGYGTFLVKRQGRFSKYRAHRVAYVLSGGTIATDQLLLHSCDNPSCCNPLHLVPGNNVENMKQRNDRCRTHRPSGVCHPLHKLNDELVKEILAIASQPNRRPARARQLTAGTTRHGGAKQRISTAGMDSHADARLVLASKDCRVQAVSGEAWQARVVRARTALARQARCGERWSYGIGTAGMAPTREATMGAPWQARYDKFWSCREWRCRQRVAGIESGSMRIGTAGMEGRRRSVRNGAAGMDRRGQAWIGEGSSARCDLAGMACPVMSGLAWSRRHGEWRPLWWARLAALDGQGSTDPNGTAAKACHAVARRRWHGRQGRSSLARSDEAGSVVRGRRPPAGKAYPSVARSGYVRHGIAGNAWPGLASHGSAGKVTPGLPVHGSAGMVSLGQSRPARSRRDLRG